MDNIEKTGYKGRLTLRHFGPDGKLIQEFTKENLIVNSGLAYFAARNTANTTLAISHMGMGTSTTSPVVTDTTLKVEIGRTTTSNSITTTTVTSDTAVFTSVFAAGVATGALVEAGLFNAASAGLMVSRVVFPVINKGASDTVSATWSIQSK